MKTLRILIATIITLGLLMPMLAIAKTPVKKGVGGKQKIVKIVKVKKHKMVKKIKKAHVGKKVNKASKKAIAAKAKKAAALKVAAAKKAKLAAITKAKKEEIVKNKEQTFLPTKRLFPEAYDSEGGDVAVPDVDPQRSVIRIISGIGKLDVYVDDDIVGKTPVKVSSIKNGKHLVEAYSGTKLMYRNYVVVNGSQVRIDVNGRNEICEEDPAFVM